MGNLFSGALAWLISNPAVSGAVLNVVSTALPAISPIVSNLAQSFLHSAPVDPATDKHVPTDAHPQQFVMLLQQLINVAQSLLHLGSPIEEDGIFGRETLAAGSALLAKAGVTLKATPV